MHSHGLWEQYRSNIQRFGQSRGGYRRGIERARRHAFGTGLKRLGPGARYGFIGARCGGHGFARL